MQTNFSLQHFWGFRNFKINFLDIESQLKSIIKSHFAIKQRATRHFVFYAMIKLNYSEE